MEAFNADILLLPNWVQIWMNILGPVVIGSGLVLLFNAQTRLIGIFTLLGMVLSVVTMLLIHGQLGMVKLLGIGHVLFWTPVVVLIWRKLKTINPPVFFKAVLWILMLTMAAALVFDYYDVISWIFGNRAPVVAA